MSDPEEWRPVYRYEGLYEVSNLGGVRRLARVVEVGGAYAGRKRRHRARLMKPTLSVLGRYMVGLTKDKSRKTVYVHRLVLEAFAGPADHLMACHFNGVPTDNRLSNLRWGTRSDNVRDSIRHGTHPFASRTHCPRGHPYSGDNLRIAKVVGQNRQQRVCRACRRSEPKEPKPPLTHCMRGHELTPENSYTNGRRGRSCKTCQKMRDKARRNRVMVSGKGER